MTHDSGHSPFRQHASGLYVPEEHSRQRIVWTREDYKLIDRAVKFLEREGITVYFQCRATTECANTAMERIRAQDGGILLRCAHAERVVNRTKLK